MRLEVHVEIGGAALTDEDTSARELHRILERVADDLEWLDKEGDAVKLFDFNGNRVGYAALVPDWTVGEEVWVTTREGTHLRATIDAVTPAMRDRHAGFTHVTPRSTHSYEPLTPVLVDHHGRDANGKPVLGRVR